MCNSTVPVYAVRVFEARDLRRRSRTADAGNIEYQGDTDANELRNRISLRYRCSLRCWLLMALITSGMRANIE